MESSPHGHDRHRKATAILLALLGVLSLFLWRMTWNGGETPAQMAGAAAAPPAALADLRAVTDYQRALWHPIHFKPQIDKATDAECLACHSEVLSSKVLGTSPAGVKSATAIAWYQTLDTYNGQQETFHTRHLTTPLARELMNLKCTFCHQGIDPRDKAPGSSATTTPAVVGKTLRKTVDSASTCLLCHGQFPAANMGLDGKWSELRDGLEGPETPNGCMTCHSEQFRTNRHHVNYLKAGAIEAAAKTSSDVCYGCHGGRAWYRISYPYPRHPWPGMDASATPDWAKGRPTQSRTEHLVGISVPK